MIKFIACDLDDSLLDRSGKISPENKAAIKLVREKGIGLTIATGRMFQSAAAFARELGLDEEQPLICYNGAWFSACLEKHSIMNRCQRP